MKLIDKYIDKSKVSTVVDAGCDEGSKTFLLAKIFDQAEVKGIDFARTGIEHANKVYAMENTTFSVMDISELRTKVDLITCLEVLEHIDDWKSVVDKFIQCAPQYIIISVPTGRMRECEKLIGHVRNFRVGEIEKNISGPNTGGYRVLAASYGGFPFYSPILRNYQNMRGNKNYVLPEHMSKRLKLAHKIVSYILRYCCFQNKKGDTLIAIFKKDAGNV